MQRAAAIVACSANILLDAGLRAKVSDYGITRASPRSQSKTSTMTNVIIGTTVYMAPEYLTGGRVSDKIDAYGFGVVCICSTARVVGGN